MNLEIDNRQELAFSKTYSDIINKVARQVLILEDYEPDEFEVSVSIVSNEEIKKLNKQYRGIDKVTDVLSFPLESGNCLGDIVISLQRAIEQAEEYGHSIEREIGFLTAHSMLHLLGYDHLTEEDEKIMFNLQEKTLEKLELHRFN